MAIIKTESLPYPRHNEKVTKTFAEGVTLRVSYKTYQIMSDVWEQGMYAEWYNAETNTVETADWIDSGSKADASPEVIALAKKALYDRRYNIAFERYKNAAENEAREIVKGSKVKVVSGRTAKALEGPVVVTIERPYGMGYRSNLETKVAIAKTDVTVKVVGRNGKVYENYRDLEWVWARNCELIEVPTIDLQSVKERAQNEAAYEVKICGW